MRRFIGWLNHKLFYRWVRVVVTDPDEIARIKNEFGIENRINNMDVWIAPLPPEADYSPGTWVEPKGKP